MKEGEATHQHDSGGTSVGLQRPFSDLLLIVRERWLLALLAATTAAGALYFYRSQVEPEYTAVASILFEITPEQVMNVQEVSDPTLASQGLEVGMENYLAHLNSLSFIDGVVQTLTDSEREKVVQPYSQGDHSKGQAMSIVRQGFSFRRTGGGTALVLIQVHRDPEMAAFLINRITDEFSTFILSRSGRANDSALAFLEAQADELREKVKLSDLALQHYRARHNVISLEDSQNLVVTRLQTLNGAATRARINVLGAQTIIKEIESAEKSGQPLMNVPAIRRYGAMEAEIERRENLQREREILSRKYLERHPRMSDNEVALNFTKDRIKRLVQEARAHYEQQLAAAKMNAEDTREELARVEQEALELDRLAVEYKVLERRLETDQRTFAALINRLNEARIASQLLQSPIRIVDEAEVPSKPSSPNPRSDILAALGLFSVIFAGIPGLFIFLDMRIKGRADIEQFLGAEFLGDAPLFKTLKTEGLPLMVRDRTNHVYVEKINTIRARLSLANQATYPSILMVTSALPQEGKSTIANNLAYSYARHGVRTLLVDADLRAPVLHRYNGIPKNRGLVQLVLETDASATPLEETGIVNLAARLDLLTSGGEVDNPTELLSMPAFGEVIEGFRTSYDLVIVDTPPAFVFSDAWQVAEFADASIAVAHYNRATRHQMKLFLSSMQKNRAQFLGIVFNGSPRSEGTAYSYEMARQYRKPEKTRPKTRPEPEKAGLPPEA